MKTLREYRIPFLGLKNGQHHFTFTLNTAFFEAFDYSEIEEAKLQANVTLERQTSMLVFDTRLDGTVMVPCDRCGDPIEQPVTAEFRLIVKFGQETGDSDGDVLILGPQEFEVDMAQYLYEYAHLALPARRVHPQMEDCNQDVIRELEKYTVSTDAGTEWIALKDMEHAEGLEDLDDQEPDEEE